MKIYTVILSLFIFSLLSAKTISLSDAKKIGENFLSAKQSEYFKSARMVSLTELSIGGVTQKSAQMSDQALFVFNEEQKGFVIISGDDRVKPVLAYSNSGHLDGNNLPDAFLELLATYEEEISLARKSNTADDDLLKVWEALRQNDAQLKSGSMAAAVVPMLSTSWSQRPYYNAMCPQDLETGQRAVTGCVATALAQVLNFHEHPAKAEGYFSYIENDFGLQNVLFFNATYNWDKMPDVLNASSLPEEHSALAQLMYHCGVGVRMNYGIGQSGASMNALRNSLRQYFAYSNTLQIRSQGSKTFDEWGLEVKLELDAGRPLLYAGFGKGSGHAFVLDGYTDDQFHINWGWGGSSDGYFALTALNPASYPSGFNSWQQGVFGVEPRAGYKRSRIELNKALSFQNDTIFQFSPCDLTVDVINKSADEFSGYLSLVFFDKDTVEVNYGGGKYGLKLSNEETLGDDTLIHISHLNLAPGSYLAAVLFREDGGELAVADGAFSNFIEIEVASSLGEGVLVMTDSIRLRDSVPVSKDSLWVELSVRNSGLANYNGQLRLEVYNKWGNKLSTLDSMNITGLNPGDTAHLSFKIDTLKLYPGRYYLRIFERPQGETFHLQVQSNQYPNPLAFDVLPIPPKGDKYEANDTIVQASLIPLQQSGNSLWAEVDSASIHLDEDKDFFAFALPEGPYRYSAWLTVSSGGGRDKGDSQGEGESSFHLMAHAKNNSFGPWESYSSESLLLDAGDTLIVEVFPFFLGLTGDYSLHVSIYQTIITDSDPPLQNATLVYPNPAKEYVTISAQSEIMHAELMDLNGKTVKQIMLNGERKEHLSLQGIVPGMYFLKTTMQNGEQNVQTLQVVQ